MSILSAGNALTKHITGQFQKYGGWIVPFRLFAAKRRHAKRRKSAMRKNEKTKKCHAKRRNNAMRKDEKKPPMRNDELLARKDKKPLCEKTPFETLFLSSFRVASFRFFAWHLFVFSPGVISSFRMAYSRLFVAK